MGRENQHPPVLARAETQYITPVRLGTLATYLDIPHLHDGRRMVFETQVPEEILGLAFREFGRIDFREFKMTYRWAYCQGRLL